MAKVSVILPIYNVEMYLRECLDSVTRQTLKDLEIICVNDGSADQSLDIINEYAQKDDRIVVITGPNGGYGKAMNKGLDRATGEYIGIVEPDDYVSLTMFEDLYQAAVENQVDLVKADFYRFTRNDKGDMQLNYNHLSKQEDDYNRIINPQEEQQCFLFIMNTWSGIYKRSFIEKFHIRHNETPGASYQDNGFWFRTFCRAEKVLFLDRPYYRNRRDNVNSSMFNRNKVYCMNEEYAYIKGILSDQGIWEKFRDIYAVKRYQNYLGTLNRIAFEYKHKYVLDISNELKKDFLAGEINKTFFTEREWQSISFLMNEPESYYTVNILRSRKEKTLESELNSIKKSTTYKVGRLVMYIPCKIKDLFLKK